MPRQSKSKTQVSETTNVINSPVVEQVVAPVEKTTKTSSKVPKVAVPKVVVDLVVPEVVNSVASSKLPVVVENVEVDVGDIVSQSTEFLAKLNQLGALFTALKTDYRALEKKWSRALKTAEKSQAKRKRKSGNRQPSGFVKPTKISDELANFLEKPIGTEMARTDVTREINTYIRAHKLQDKDNGRKINPDDKLAALLKLKKTDELTYFNLQRYMSPHFSKNEKVVLAAAADATVSVTV